MRIVELFAGLEGWSSAASEADTVVTSDLEPRFGTTITADVLEPDLGARIVEALGGRPDLVLASPPCEAFSVLTIGRHWTGPDDDPPHEPKTDHARLARRIVERTLELIDELGPSFYVIENPRAKLRVLPVVAGLERRTVTYCQLGEPFQKPTDLWGGFPPSLELPPTCRPGASCHRSAPRGSRTGIQGDHALEAEPDLTAEELEALGPLTREDGQEPLFAVPLTPLEAVMLKLGLPHGTPRSLVLSALRARVPRRLSELVIEAARRDLGETEER